MGLKSNTKVKYFYDLRKSPSISVSYHIIKTIILGMLFIPFVFVCFAITNDLALRIILSVFFLGIFYSFIELMMPFIFEEYEYGISIEAMEYNPGKTSYLSLMIVIMPFIALPLFIPIYSVLLSFVIGMSMIQSFRTKDWWNFIICLIAMISDISDLFTNSAVYGGVVFILAVSTFADLIVWHKTLVSNGAFTKLKLWLKNLWQSGGFLIVRIYRLFFFAILFIVFFYFYPGLFLVSAILDMDPLEISLFSLIATDLAQFSDYMFYLYFAGYILGILVNLLYHPQPYTSKEEMQKLTQAETEDEITDSFTLYMKYCRRTKELEDLNRLAKKSLKQKSRPKIAFPILLSIAGFITVLIANNIPEYLNSAVYGWILLMIGVAWGVQQTNSNAASKTKIDFGKYRAQFIEERNSIKKQLTDRNFNFNDLPVPEDRTKN